jgi:hypothetical protein
VVQPISKKEQSAWSANFEVHYQGGKATWNSRISLISRNG